MAQQIAFSICPGRFRLGRYCTIVWFVRIPATELGMISQKMSHSHFPRSGACFAASAFLAASASSLLIRYSGIPEQLLCMEQLPIKLQVSQVSWPFSIAHWAILQSPPNRRPGPYLHPWQFRLSFCAHSAQVFPQ